MASSTAARFSNSRFLLSILACVAVCCALGCPAGSGDGSGSDRPTPTDTDAAAGTDVETPSIDDPTPDGGIRDDGTTDDGTTTQDTPIDDTPIDDTPIDDTPIDDTPIDDTPTDDTTTQDVLEDDPSADGTPAVAVATESTAKGPLKWLDWTDPQLVLFVTGRQHGYFEPCGCAGLDNQLGGLARRHGALAELRRVGWNVVPLDMGNQIRRFGRQAEIKFQRTVDDALKPMGYEAIAFGPDDLRLSAGELLASVAGIGDAPSRFVCANASVFELNLAFRVIEVGGRKVGVTSVVGAQYQRQINNDDVSLTPPDEALRAVLPKLRSGQCDLLVLLSHSTIDESKRLARQFPDFDVVVTTGGAGEPTNAPIEVAGTDAVFIQTGTKGMYAGLIGLFDSAEKPIRYRRIELDERFKDSPDMLDLLASYQEQLQTLGFDGLGIKPIPHRSGQKFVGSDACADCHEKADKIWRRSKHGHALDTLVKPPERGNIPRYFDPECIACHVTGWDEKNYLPYVSGYLNREKTPEMEHVGCESCHGPGSTHVAVELGDVEASDDQIDQLREQMKLPLAKAPGQTQSRAELRCMECHDMDNSPAFQEEGAFDRYWRKVKHEGKD